ncbi:MAG: hypothetical protein ACLR6H_02035 [Roseburia sp.]
MEIVAQGEISRRTAYRYKAYYDEVQKNNRYKKKKRATPSAIIAYRTKNPFLNIKKNNPISFYSQVTQLSQQILPSKA